jgi:NIPSNAP
VGAPESTKVVELRQYTLHPGQRDVLIELFDRELVDPQEEGGMKAIGQFRDLDRANRFVWLRGFRDMKQRARALEAFYDGPVWARHRDAANATMIDSSDVLLLRPAAPGSAFPAVDRVPQANESRDEGVVHATIVMLESPTQTAGAVDYFERTLAPSLRESGGSILGYYSTLSERNTFPRLPVREGETVFVFFVGYAGGSVRETMPAWRAALVAEPGPQTLRLSPTSRSLLVADSPACGGAGAR